MGVVAGVKEVNSGFVCVCVLKGGVMWKQLENKDLMRLALLRPFPFRAGGELESMLKAEAGRSDGFWFQLL